MHEVTYLAAVAGDFAHEARADVGRVERRDHEYGLQARRQMAIHESHLILVLEIADGAQAANQKAGADLSGEVHKEAAEGADLDSGLILDRGADERDPLVDREEGLLGGV